MSTRVLVWFLSDRSQSGLLWKELLQMVIGVRMVGSSRNFRHRYRSSSGLPSGNIWILRVGVGCFGLLTINSFLHSCFIYFLGDFRKLGYQYLLFSNLFSFRRVSCRIWPFHRHLALTWPPYIFRYTLCAGSYLHPGFTSARHSSSQSFQRSTWAQSPLSLLCSKIKPSWHLIHHPIRFGLWCQVSCHRSL